MKKPLSSKIKALAILLMFLSAFFVFSAQPTKAGMATAEITSIPQILSDTKLTIREKVNKILKTFGSKLVNTTIRNTLNRVALDAAKYVASAGEGQKPTYVVEDFSDYWKNIGDAAAGDFIDGLGKAWEVDLCQPPSPSIQAKIGLGLVQTIAPSKPNCTLSNLVNNYSSAYERFKAMESGDYLKGIKTTFDPGGSELSGAFTLFGRTVEVGEQATDEEKTKNLISQGWLDVRNIAGKLRGTPGSAQEDLSNIKKAQVDNIFVSTGDALVDAANTFLNQLAYESFQRIMREINKGKSTSQALDITKLSSSGFESLIQYGEAVIGEKLASVVKPRFDVRSDYSILAELSICPDKDNPGPNNCVIDDNFSQAVAEKITVGEALEKGYLHGDWQISGDNKAESVYSTRSASILRKYRIVPLGWEQAFNTAAINGYKATFQDLVSCFSADDNYSQFSSDFNKNNVSWCEGLVDPNWVLKAPLNSCAKEGIGGQILSSYISPTINNEISSLIIARATDYCADDQTCIKEKTDGSCELYGYCNEEKRTWRFNSDSCEAVYNTCQTFTNATDNQTLSFLENTLDYSTCDANNVGCREFYYRGIYNAEYNNITWDKKYPLYLNNKVTACDANDESCTQLLRGKPGWVDVNYVMDSGFALNSVGDTTTTSTEWHWPIRNGSGEIVNELGKALKISGGEGASLYSNSQNNLLPQNMQPVTGWAYTLSAEVKINSGSKVTMSFGSPMRQVETTSHDWVRLSVTSDKTASLDFAISGSGGGVEFLVRNLKLSPNSYSSNYSMYGAYPVYEKILPDYLEATCYNSPQTGDFTLKANAPASCFQYARKCSSSEVGCDLFSSTKDRFKIAAKATEADYCDAQCEGYDTYVAKSTHFFSTTADNIIPAKAQTCSAESVGCASFTNLDRVSQGGEGVEYYSQLRQCVKPQEASCGDFYSWDDSQLVVMSLRTNANGTPYLINTASSAQCTKEIYSLPASDPRYNPNCREFYSKDGRITYHLISETVACSENCNSYRLNSKNYDKTISQGACNGTDKNWDNTQGACQVCLNGGLWDRQQQSCTYKAIPEQGKMCGAQNVGCREYNGKDGNAFRLVSVYDFDANNPFTGSALSNDSIFKDGKSIHVGQGGTTASVGADNYAVEGSAYVVKFLAKPIDRQASVRFVFANKNNDTAIFGVTPTNASGYTSLASGWQVYEVSLDALNHKPDQEQFRIEVTGQALLDNIIISEVTDRYYLIKDTSEVPDVCSYDMNDVYRGPSYNLGCSKHTDRAGAVHYLHQFSELCQDSAIGCEQMIKTNNHSNYYGFTVNQKRDNTIGAEQQLTCEPGTPGCVTVPDHQAIYAVFDPTKQCNKAATGCTRLGTMQTKGGTTIMIDVFRRLMPDNYRSENNSTLCHDNELGCDAWTYGNGSASYFKNPGNNTCVYRDNAWYKTPVKRCDLNSNNVIDTDAEKKGAICSLDADCSDNKKCIVDNNPYPCEVDYGRTLGSGGAASRIPSPVGAVGLCSAEASGCTEYIDPVSRHAANLIFNPSALESSNSLDRWTLENGRYYQDVDVKPNKLYTLTTTDGVSGLSISMIPANFGRLRTLHSDNKLGAEVVSLDLSQAKKALFYTNAAAEKVRIYRTDIKNNQNIISLREVIVNYQLDTQVDLKSCNGVVNVDNGCVLFNVRSQSGASGLRQNIYDAVATSDNSNSPAPCEGDSCTANQVIKVSPDRVCSRWLSCQTYVEDPVTKERTCYKMGECDQLDDKGECANFLTESGERNIKDGSNKNATGYSLLGNYYLGEMKEVGGNTDARYDFDSNSFSLGCRRDVGITSASGLYNSRNKPCSFEKNINEDSLVLSPDKATTDYPAQGTGYLKVLGYYQISPHADSATISVSGDRDYYINYLVNTKNSGARAKLIIADGNNSVITSFVDEAPNGWERKVNKFKVPGAGSKSIKIFLTSDTNTLSTTYVYFDDINIEPVLQVGEDKYVSKECRLYPAEDSHTCLSANNNVIKDGLYGYCLQRDPLNPKVCLMWYPVDQISTVSRVFQSDLGYSGKFPLYYCTEANGDFDLIEKVEAKRSGFNGELGRFNFLGSSACKKDEDEECGTCRVYKNGCWTPDTFNRNGRGDPNYWTLVAAGSYRKGWLTHDRVFVKMMCIPNQENLKLVTGTVPVTDMNACNGWTYKKDAWSEPQPVKEGWATYDGSLEYTTYTIDSGTQKDFCNLDFGAFKPWCDQWAFTIDQKKSHEPYIAVYDNTIKPALEEDLKYPYGQQDIYQITCNKFSQMVSNSGENIAWANRISRSTSPTSTPAFFFNSFYGYGRNREDVPFGAAVIPSDFNLGSNDGVPLRGQYSKKNRETVFAGRPYGCSEYVPGIPAPGCQNIGYCSLDPNVFCFYHYNDSELNRLTCSGVGGGSCLPLWSNASIPNEGTALRNLNQIFVKKYGDLRYSIATKGYESYNPNNYGNFVEAEQINLASSQTSQPSGYTAPASMYRIKPVISNQFITGVSEGVKGASLTVSGGNVTITKPGLYKLSFNTLINIEQQPLKRLTIDWGNTAQSVSGVDHKPESSSPHILYHYYLPGTYKLLIQVEDNWKTWTCEDINGNPCSSRI